MRFYRTDTEAELSFLRERCIAAGALDAVVSSHWSDGGKGAVDLAESIIKATDHPSDFKFLYDVNLSIEEKIETICREMYRADGIEILRTYSFSTSFFLF